MSGLLSRDAIALLERLFDDWMPAESVSVDVGTAPWRELAAAGLVDERVWPPLVPGAHRASRAARARVDEVSRETQVRRTLRGTERLTRIRAGAGRGGVRG